MRSGLVFCPKCGAADSSVPDAQGVRCCSHCRVCYQIQSAVGQGASAPRSSSTALVLVFSLLGLVVVMGLGMAVYLMQRTAPPNSPEVAHRPVPPNVKAPPEVEPSPEVEPLPEVEPPPEVKTPPEVTPVVEPPDAVPPTPGARPGRPDPALRYRVDIAGANVRGAKDSPVTLVLFYDFECPFCGRVNASIDEVTAHYGKDVRIAYMHNPLTWHKNAMGAAKAVEAAAEQGKFLEMYALLHKNPKALSRADLDSYAKQLGLKKARFDKVFDDPATERRIKSQQAEANRLRAYGVPSSFVNGRFLSGAQPFTAFSTLIDAELIVAKKMIAGGTDRDAVYETLMKDALPGV